MVMHTLGGMFLAVIFALLFKKSFLAYSHTAFTTGVLVWVLIVGIGWELFEYIVQHVIKPVTFATVNDSISDLFCDIFGGMIGAYFVIRTKKRYNSTHEHIQNA